MPDILIHRCTLRVIRRAGWNWGSDPKRVAREAVRILPDLLAKKLSELLPDAEDHEIAAPVRIAIPIRLSELDGDAAARSAGGPAPGARTRPPLEQRVESALCAALGLRRETPSSTLLAGTPSAASARFVEKASAGQHPDDGGALPRLLFSWQAEGALERRLAALESSEIETWHDYLYRAATAAILDPDAALVQELEAFLHARPSPSAGVEFPQLLRLRILIATDIAAGLTLPLTHSPLWRVLDYLLPAEPFRSPEQSVAILSGTRDSSEPQEALPPSTFKKAPQSAAPDRIRPAAVLETQPEEWEIKVACALPFLLLGPLARIGYIAALNAVLEAANLKLDAHLFAAALAHKVLDPPERGWRRNSDSLLAAAAAAGSAKPLSEESLVEFSRRFASHTSGLDLTLADSIIAGHTPGALVTLHRAVSAGQEELLIDTQGCFPIAWTSDRKSILQFLRRLGFPIVLISPEAADAFLLRDLDAGGVTFISSVPPTRGENWGRIHQGPAPLGWTNSRQPSADMLRFAAREMAAASDEARTLTKEVIEDRPGVIRAPSPQLDRTLSLAASVAMGLIAWRLWQSRGRTSPQQVLERFADLEGRVRFKSKSVQVSLPLGRRHNELRENGLLAPIHDIPWFGRRSIEFGSG